jgi:signal peptidase II
MPGVARNRTLLFCLIAVIGCGLDLATKAWFFSWPELYGGNVYWLWTGHVGIQLSWNEGALFGIGHGSVWLFTALSVLAGLAITAWMFYCGAEQDGWLTSALGCVMAGILGNLYDRLGLPDQLWPGRTVDVEQPVYAVRDWILWQWNDQWRWPNFNVADSLLVVGAAILVWHATQKPDGPEHSPSSTGNH